MSVATIAPECADQFSNPNRFTSCSDDFWAVRNWRTVNGVTTLIGEMDIEIESSVEFDDPSAGQSGAGWDLNTEVTVYYTWGNLETGTTGSIWQGCYQHPDKCSTTVQAGSNSNFPEPITLSPGSLTRKWYTQLSAAMPTNNIITNLYGNLCTALLVNTPAGQITLVDHAGNTLWGRCDVGSFSFGSTIISNRYGAGCVDDLGLSLVLYSTPDNPSVGPVAAHVYDAIRALPSHWGSPFGSPLNRLMDPVAVGNNRAISCSGVISPPGFSCDEYPLATTYQGGNGASADDRSTRVVPQTANNSQGGLTSGYYDYYRVVNSDPFFVQAVLADGSTAW